MAQEEAQVLVQGAPSVRVGPPASEQVEGQRTVVARSAVRRSHHKSSALGVRPKGSPRTVRVYARYALTHPWQLVALAGAVILGVVHFSVVLPLVALAAVELALFTVVIRLPVFQVHVDAHYEQLARARAAEQRAVLLSQMREGHRSELALLEAVVDRTRNPSKPYGPAAQAVADECLGLLSTYVRLAIAYNSSRESLDLVDRARLDDETRALEDMLSSPCASARDLARRRLHIARRRIERWDQSNETLEVISQQLAMIGDLVRLTHEQLAAPTDPRADTDEIDGIASVLVGRHAATEELTALLRVEPSIDCSVLDRGRRSLHE
jgi:hypothetical protein